MTFLAAGKRPPVLTTSSTFMGSLSTGYRTKISALAFNEGARSKLISTVTDRLAAISKIDAMLSGRLPIPSSRRGISFAEMREVSSLGLRMVRLRRGGEERWSASNFTIIRQTSGPNRVASQVRRLPLDLLAVRHCQTKLAPERAIATKLPIPCIQSVMEGCDIRRGWKRRHELSSVQSRRDRVSRSGPLSSWPSPNDPETHARKGGRAHNEHAIHRR